MQVSYQPTQITPAIYRGSNPCRSAATTGNLNQSESAVLQHLKKAKFTHIVCLLEPGNNKAIPHYAANKFNVVPFPIPDFGVPNATDLALLIDKMIEIAKNPQNKVLVHCQGGFGRTGMVVASYLTATTGCSGDQAIAKVRRLVPHSVETRNQEKLVNTIASTFASRIRCARHIKRLETQIASAGSGKRARAVKQSLIMQRNEYLKV